MKGIFDWTSPEHGGAAAGSTAAPISKVTGKSVRNELSSYMIGREEIAESLNTVGSEPGIVDK